MVKIPQTTSSRLRIECAKPLAGRLKRSAVYFHTQLLRKTHEQETTPTRSANDRRNCEGEMYAELNVENITG